MRIRMEEIREQESDTQEKEDIKYLLWDLLRCWELNQKDYDTMVLSLNKTDAQEMMER